MSWQQPVIVSVMSLLIGGTATQVFVHNTPNIVATDVRLTAMQEVVKDHKEEVKDDIKDIKDLLNSLIKRWPPPRDN